MAILLNLKQFKAACDSLVLLGIEHTIAAERLVYSLYQSNIDTNIEQGRRNLPEMNRHRFIQAISACKGVKRPDPFRLYHLLCKINRNIHMRSITESQRFDVMRLRAIIQDMETAYYARTGREIYDEAVSASGG